MALKDWKRIVNNKDEIIYKNVKKDKWSEGYHYHLQIYKQEYEKGETTWDVDLDSPSVGMNLDSFKTKSQAMAYAMKYMRSH